MPLNIFYFKVWHLMSDTRYIFAYRYIYNIFINFYKMCTKFLACERNLYFIYTINIYPQIYLNIKMENGYNEV